MLNSPWIILLIQLSYSEFSLGKGNGNYPSWPYHEKPCMRPKTTVNLALPICVPNSNGKGFTPESEDNCVNKLKATCPEFNKVQCSWYTWYTKCTKAMQFPVCEISYFARDYVWGKIYYLNQYGTSPDRVYDIIELQRYNDKFGAFPNFQPDWPENVQDPQGERGLEWKEFEGLPWNYSSKYLKNSTFDICQKAFLQTDVGFNCGGGLREFFKTNYANGILPNGTIPAKTPKETETKAIVTSDVAAECASIMLPNLVKQRACKIAFIRRTQYSYKDSDGDPVQRDTRQQWLEVQVWQKSHNIDKNFLFDNRFRWRMAVFNFFPNVDD